VTSKGWPGRTWAPCLPGPHPPTPRRAATCWQRRLAVLPVENNDSITLCCGSQSAACRKTHLLLPSLPPPTNYPGLDSRHTTDLERVASCIIMSYPIPRPEPSRSLGASGGPGPVSPVPEARGLGEVTQGGLGDDAPQHNRRLSSGARETMPRTAPAGAWRDPHEDECVRWAQGHSPRFLEAEPALTLRRLLEPREARSQEGTSGWGSPRWGQGRGVPASGRAGPQFRP
jgi:hypothetical protein